jgi:RNA 2',3'-cyclic 3'-phosphodiesterase
MFMRLFIAIEIPHEIKNEMAEIQRRLKDGGVDASWTRPEGIHLTLKFLGEVPEAKLSPIMAALMGAANGVNGCRLDVMKVGAFPNPGSARVVWVGVSGDVASLAGLQTAVENAMAGLGFEREKRAFTPHLTLGRIKSIHSRERWLKALDSVKDARLPALEVKAISLMKSELKPSGAVYTEIGRVELK